MPTPMTTCVSATTKMKMCSCGGRGPGRERQEGWSMAAQAAGARRARGSPRLYFQQLSVRAGRLNARGAQRQGPAHCMQVQEAEAGDWQQHTWCRAVIVTKGDLPGPHCSRPEQQAGDTRVNSGASRQPRRGAQISRACPGQHLP